MFSPQQCYVGSLTMQLDGSDISLEIPHILLAWPQSETFLPGQGANPNSTPPYTLTLGTKSRDRGQDFGTNNGDTP